MKTSILLLLTLLCGNTLAQLPDTQTYRGEIRRDADGKLIAVPPAANAESRPSSAPPSAQKPSAANASNKAPPVAGKSASSVIEVPSGQTHTIRTIRVGPDQQVRSISVAATMARDGDTIEIEAGDYLADVAVFKQANLTLRGVGPTRPRLIASGASAEGKAIWVLRGGQVTVENLEFRGARVPDRNGAGIRMERGQLKVSNCKFEDNENGILTANDADMLLVIENSEFSHNGAGDGKSHNIYVGNIKKLSVTGSYFHHAKVGHLLKTRAKENHIFYNRLTDETGGRASYELDLSNGGIAYVVGNLIEQSSQTENSNIISFGPEGYKSETNELYLINNTIIDNRPSNGNILLAKQGASKIVLMNNLLVSQKKFDTRYDSASSNNLNVDWDQFVLAARFDFRLKETSKLVGKYVMPGQANGINLAPQREYVHPAGSRPLSGNKLQPGALQSLAK